MGMDKETSEVIKKRNDAKIEQRAKISMEDFYSQTGETETQYNGQFNKIFVYVRKGLLILKAKKIKGTLTGSDLIDECGTLFEKSLRL